MDLLRNGARKRFDVPRGALIAIGIGAAAGLAWWRGRGGAELAVELEDLVGMSPRAQELAAISLERNVQAFLATIRAGEGTAGPNGYRTLFGGELFSTYADHPRKAVTRLLGGRPITSTAAGAYQILARTWDEARAALEIPDFSPASQDVAALFLIRRRGALELVRAGRFDEAIAKVAKEWASLPGSPYGQPTLSLARAREAYSAAGGEFA